MEEHLRGHLTNAFTVELGIPDEPGTAAEVEADAAQTVVHRQGVAIAFDATLVAECFQKAFAESKRRILDGVVFVDMQVAIAMNGKIYHAVFADLFEHVVEESQSSLVVRCTSAVRSPP